MSDQSWWISGAIPNIDPLPRRSSKLRDVKSAALASSEIFVGAAPGVGKTYEMLQQAQARKKDGYDVVVGVVETHGRKETEALLTGLEIIPSPSGSI